MGHGLIAVIIVTDALEIIAARIERQLLAPPVFHLYIGDAVAGIEAFDLIRPAAERLLQRGLLEFFLIQSCLGITGNWP